MADDVSKKYALNIEVNVDSSSLNNLKNIQEPSFQITSSHQEDVFEKLSVSRLVAYICEDNVKSIRCATKAGMVRSGIYYVKSLEREK